MLRSTTQQQPSFDEMTAEMESARVQISRGMILDGRTQVPAAPAKLGRNHIG